MNREDIEKKAASKSINKWVGVFEEALDVEPEGSRPTERMRSVIKQLRYRLDEMESVEEIEVHIEYLILKWYRVGARRGAAETIRKLCELEIISSEDYNLLPETIEWKKRLSYTGFDGERRKIKRKKYSISI